MNIQRKSNSRSNQIKNILKQLLNLKSVQNNHYILSELEHISNRLSDDTFRIAVVGEFSSGKSTFINALIGKDILSHARLETTAAITYIKNVSQNDKRCGTCTVSFRDGTEKNLDTLNEISSYTTAQSNNNVAEKISSVTLFVNFLGNDIPVLVVDTPGLNGIAEHHREITIEEIKKAHTCIYLLSSSGITKSDVSFIRLLNDYQETFLFLQNFIDDLSASEGDSAESKVEEDDRIIRESILCEGKQFNYKIIGISALKALVSKDTSIKKLYSKDIREIEEEDRHHLYQESNFSQLESHLENLIESGEYKGVILDSVIRRMSIILEGLLGQINEEQKLNEEMRSKDEGIERINAAKTILDRIQNTQEDREKRIRNFVKSSADKQCRMIEQNLKETLNKLFEEVCKDIDVKISDYQEFLNFAKTHGKSPSLFYSNYVSQKINKDIIPEISSNADLLLHHIYEATIARVESYTKTKRNAGRIQFSIESLTDVFKMEESQTLNNIDAIEKSIANCHNKIKQFQKEVSCSESSLIDVQRSAQSIQASINACNREKSNRLLVLGSRPPVRRWETSRQVPCPRGGLGIIDAIFGIPQKTVYDQHSDDSAGIEWDRSKQRISNEYRQKEHELKNHLSDVQETIDSINDAIKQKQSSIKKLEKEILFFQEQLRIQKEIYANEVKLSQNKFCNRQKKQLKASIEEKLVNIANEMSALSYLTEYVRSIFEKNESIIENKGVMEFKKALAEQRTLFENLINENTHNLEQKYQSNESELEILDSLYNTVMEMTDT